MDSLLGPLNMLAQSPSALVVVLMLAIWYLWKTLVWLLQKDDQRWGIIATFIDLLREERVESRERHEPRED